MAPPSSLSPPSSGWAAQALDRVPQVQPNPDGPRLDRHCKEVEFKNVCFSYTPDRQILTNVCLRVPAGETIAVVGANGTGKSTLLNLLPRVFDPDYDFILTKGGYDVRVGDLGSSLSGGEKQRIVLARAILRDPSILILDEFSSAIDPVSDRLIHDALQDFKQGRTT